MSFSKRKFLIIANEAPDPVLENAGILSLQAREYKVEHYVSSLVPSSCKLMFSCLTCRIIQVVLGDKFAIALLRY